MENVCALNKLHQQSSQPGTVETFLYIFLYSPFNIIGQYAFMSTGRYTSTQVRLLRVNVLPKMAQ